MTQRTTVPWGDAIGVNLGARQLEEGIRYRHGILRGHVAKNN